MAEWFTQKDQRGFPVERTVVGYYALSVLYAGGEWRWLIQHEGRDITEVGARSSLAARGYKPKQLRGGSYSARNASSHPIQKTRSQYLAAALPEMGSMFR